MPINHPSIELLNSANEKIKKFLEQLQQAELTEQIINPDTEIQRVVPHLRVQRHLAKHYTPSLVSIGPIHHGARNLEPGERYKRIWTSMYLERTKQHPLALCQKIASNIDHLKGMFAWDIIQVFSDIDLTLMLLLDGCALLQILDKGEVDKPEELEVTVAELVFVLQDVVLLENQLPYELLQLLSHHEHDDMLLETMNKFLLDHHFSPGARNKHSTISREARPFHLLDQLRKLVVEDARCDHEHEVRVRGLYEYKNKIIVHRNAQELKAAGIRVKRSNSGRISDVHLTSGWLWSELWLPAIMVHDTAATTFLNLIAYELCPDFKHCRSICSFVAFVDSLIDHPDDVKELRSVGVLHNALGSDEEVAKLFNTISSDTDVVADTERYIHVRVQIEKQYRRKWRTWIARGYHTYFSSPGTIIAFYAAVAALLLTFIQTWCNIKQL